MEQPRTSKSKRFQKKEFSLQNKLNDYILTYYSHYNVPGINVNKQPWVDKWDLENIMQLFKPYPYICDLPKPLLPPSKMSQCLLTNSDPATDIIFTKHFIQENMDRILNNYQKHFSDHISVQKKDVKWKVNRNKYETVLPKYVADLADIIEMDPDPSFNGKYNWYYTGGSLTGLKLNGQFILLFPYINDLVAMPISVKDNLICKPKYKRAARCRFGNTIYELKQKVSPYCRILARLKHECIIFALKESRGNVQMIALDNKVSTVPFVSADMAPWESAQYCTLDVNQKIDICDLVSGKIIAKGDMSSAGNLSDNWGSLKYQTFNPDIITYCNRNYIHYLDTRMEMTEPVLTMSPKSQLEDCENISLQLNANRDYCLYVGTYHHFLLCDDRDPYECVYQKWSHQLKSAPLHGSVCMRDEAEIIVLSSQICTDTSIILNNWGKSYRPHSFYQPVTPPSILNTVRECQHLGKCLDPLLTQRLQLSTTGVHVETTANNDSFIFYQNSIGDLFYQCISHNVNNAAKISFFNSHAHYALDRWEQKILEQNKPLMPLMLSDQVNMEDAFIRFSRKKLKYKPRETKESFLQDYWKQPIEKLSSYADLLAPELLSAWDVVEENELRTSSDRHQKVLNWLVASSDNPVIENLQETIDNDDDDDNEEPFECTPIDSQELVSVSQLGHHCVNRYAPMEVNNELIRTDHNNDLSGNKIKVKMEQDFLPEDVYFPSVKAKKGKKENVKKKAGHGDGF